MEIKDALREIREHNHMTQEEFADLAMVSRQAVSRWETGETRPNVETLRRLSREFDVSINTLLGSPRVLVCQCCGMPMRDDTQISREPDGGLNENYCIWCYSGGVFAYGTMDSLLDFLLTHMPNPENLSDEARRAQYLGQISQLEHWRNPGGRQTARCA